MAPSGVAPVGRMLDEKIGPGKYSAVFVADRESYLLLKVTYHSGWRARLDGEEVTPVMLSPGFIGVKVGPGVHEAVIWYTPRPWRLPLLGFGLLVLAGLFVFEGIRPLRF